MKAFTFIFIVSLSFAFSMKSIGQGIPLDSLRQIAIQAPNYSEIDTYDIFEFFESKVDNNRENVLLFVYWIAENISYDVAKYLTDDMTYTSVDHTLETRKTMCQGYAELVCELCEWAEIECEVVKGYVKGFGYDGKPLTKINHLWNAVLIDDKWELLDATWASGFLSGRARRPRFKQKFRGEYVFPNPDYLILTHFPITSEWQLLQEPLTLEEFYSKEHETKRIETITIYE